MTNTEHDASREACTCGGKKLGWTRYPCQACADTIITRLNNEIDGLKHLSKELRKRLDKYEPRKIGAKNAYLDAMPEAYCRDISTLKGTE